MFYFTIGNLVNEWMIVYCYKLERICLIIWCVCEGMVLLKFMF